MCASLPNGIVTNIIEKTTMKKIVILLCFLTITSASYAMELVKYERPSLRGLDNVVDHEKIAIDMPACSSLIAECKQFKYSACPNTEKLKIIAQGIGLGLGTFGILETFTALLGTKGMTSDPTILVVYGCTSLVFSIIYIGALLE